MDRSDQNDCDALLALFSQLSTPRSKRLALEGLIKTLSHQEIRDVQTYVKNIHYRKDFFSELPLELSQRIAGYLGLPNSIRARRVSRNWLNILGSTQTTRCLLQPWQGIGNSNLRIPEGLSPRAISSLEAERICAYCTGTAFDRSTVRAPLPQNGPISNHVAYSSGRVAWIDKRTSITHLLTLEDSGACLTNRSDDDIMSHIALSSLVMVVTTLWGQCHVTELTTRAEHRFQLSPTNLQSVVVAKGTVAILHRPLNHPLQASVMTWTLHDRIAVHFSAGLHRSVDQALKPSDLRIMLDASGARVIIFERVTEARLVHFTRFGLGGQVHAEGTLELPDMEGYSKHSEEGTLTHTNGWATVWSYSKTHEEISDRFMETTEMLRVQCHPEREFLRLKKDSYEFYKAAVWPMSNVFFWNDIAYSQTSIGNGLTGLTVVDFSASSLDIVAMGRGTEHEWWGLREPERQQFRNGGGMAQSIFFGDERFLVNVCQHGFFVWVFDKGHGMTGTDAKYREERREATKDKHGPWGSWAQLADR